MYLKRLKSNKKHIKHFSNNCSENARKKWSFKAATCHHNSIISMYLTMRLLHRRRSPGHPPPRPPSRRTIPHPSPRPPSPLAMPRSHSSAALALALRNPRTMTQTSGGQPAFVTSALVWHDSTHNGRNFGREAIQGVSSCA